MAHSPHFPYSPLNDAEDRQQAFRLLTILPNTEEAAVKCQLENVYHNYESPTQKEGNSRASQSKSSLPKRARKSAALFRRRTKLLRRRNVEDSTSTLPHAYEAISYAWGVQEQTEQILLNEQSFRITPTLEHALRRLRYSDQPRKIWVDAICIDQENAEEKKCQIRQMQHIFANASRVVVWLGESSADSMIGLAFAKTLSTLAIEAGGLGEYFYSPTVPTVIKELLCASNTLNWSALHRLISRPWWLRAWIVQEVVVAKDLIFLCGNTTISWREFSEAIRVIRATYEHFTSSHYFKSENGYCTDSPTCQAVFDLVLDRKKGGGGIWDCVYPGSLQWLSSNRLRLCKFPHDKIYSLLGLTSSLFQHSISIDYDRPVDYLYKTVVKASIIETKSLDILCHSQNSVWHPEYPSWMPDWRLGQRCVILTSHSGRHSWKAHASFSRDLSELRVKGVVIDAVIETQLEYQLLPGLNKTGVAFDVDGHVVIQTDSPCHLTIATKTLHELYTPALKLWSTQELTYSDAALLNIFLKLLSIKRSPSSFDLDWHRKTSCSVNSNTLQPRVQLPEMTDFQELQDHLETLLISRTIIVTRGQLAIAPDISQPGDVLCLISGCDPPVILRPCSNGTFKFIGDVFLGSDKLGQDEMFQQLDEEFFAKLRDIVLV